MSTCVGEMARFICLATTSTIISMHVMNRCAIRQIYVSNHAMHTSDIARLRTYEYVRCNVAHMHRFPTFLTATMIIGMINSSNFLEWLP